jgi:hypothetical protein
MEPLSPYPFLDNLAANLSLHLGCMLAFSNYGLLFALEAARRSVFLAPALAVGATLVIEALLAALFSLYRRSCSTPPYPLLEDYHRPHVLFDDADLHDV